MVVQQSDLTIKIQSLALGLDLDFLIGRLTLGLGLWFCLVLILGVG